MGMFKTAKWALSTKDERKLSEVRDTKPRKGDRRSADEVIELVPLTPLKNVTGARGRYEATGQSYRI